MGVRTKRDADTGETRKLVCNMVKGRPLVGTRAHHGVTQAGRLLPTQWENGVLRPRQQHQQSQ
ncbi:MAG: hypothetical protein ACYCZP_05345 [Acidimicrobiales bacterium]